MQTFEITLDSELWLEVSHGCGNLMFDLLSASPDATVFYTDVGTYPSGAGNNIYSHEGDWDFISTGMGTSQRIWIKGSGVLRGVRG